MGQNRRREIIAFDIGGTNIRCGLVCNGKIIRFEKTKTPSNKDEFLKKIVGFIRKFNSDDVGGIGIGFPGQIKNGRVMGAPNLPLKKFNLKKYLEGKFKKRVEIRNDASCVALAESKFGCKKKNFVVMTLGTGIGGGIIIDGKQYFGKGFGGEIGHIRLGEEYFETKWQASRKKMRDGLRVYLVSDLVKMKSERAKKITAEMIEYLGQGISSVINLLDPEVVILSGGVKECGATLLKPIVKSVKKYAFYPRRARIQWTNLKHPGTLGAALLLE